MDRDLKTLVKWLVVIILAGAAAIGAYYFDRSVTAPIVHIGTTVTFTTDTDYFLLINADSVTFKAASSEWFVLHKVNGEVITPTQVEPPLGTYDTYYVFGPASISGGEWDVSEGNPMVQITSDTPVTVTEVITSNQLSWKGFGSCAVGVLIFLFALIFLSWTPFYNW